MASELPETVSQGARQCKTAQSFSGRASPALPVTSRRGGRQRPRPARSRPGPQLPPLLTAPDAGRRVPDSPRGVRSALAARAECPGLPQPRRRPGRPCQAAGGAPARISRSGREQSARIRRPSRPPSWLLSRSVLLSDKKV
ncbi:hypothetical protein NDU88_004793 [Pleurodeles waltl]|uniref:Uncharacterized protein n=1 Tax=Pleurodeles waltl TaxID=8319 RepID=A0AAV7V215_PLEWA|nr:hypothetical protein NDU88_004786 [Pleurodeles waltl]KAJ1195514.1 hypothetical protein NDU88_004793 [Pleurodeles waltl]